MDHPKLKWTALYAKLNYPGLDESNMGLRRDQPMVRAGDELSTPAHRAPLQQRHRHQRQAAQQPRHMVHQHRHLETLLAVLRIHEHLVRIRLRIRGSIPLTNGSGSGS